MVQPAGELLANRPLIDRRYLVEMAASLARVPTNVPLGYQTLMEPDHPKLVHYVQEVLRPELVRLGAYELIDAGGNNLVVALGPPRAGRSMLIQSYCVTQHHNLMSDPFSGKVGSAREHGVDGPAVFGQGMSQAKAHQAVLLSVVKLLLEQAEPLGARVYWSINCEARSTHDCTSAILAAIGDKPSCCVVQYGTGLRLSLGNRGRLDVNIHVQGKATHSSQPDQGLSAIDGANEVLNRLKSLAWPDRHPILGGRQAVPYKIEYAPLAPHTLPSDAWIAVDRRLLPGDVPEAATAEVQRCLGDLSPFHLEVSAGACMLPALIDPSDPFVRTFQTASRQVLGTPAEQYHHGGTYDAGGTASAGIPTVMFGASGGTGLTGVDFVPISAMVTEAEVLARLVLNQGAAASGKGVSA